MHLMVHSNYVINSNNTIASTGGNVVHIGQFFFEQDLNDEVFATAPYSESTSALTTNDEVSSPGYLQGLQYRPKSTVEMEADRV